MKNISTIDFLYQLRNRGSKLGLHKIGEFLDLLGRPERSYPIIHVAGTNGKGSVCAMLEAIYRKNGYKTGLYTSPHLVKLGERIQVNRMPLKDSQIDHYVQSFREIFNQNRSQDNASKSKAKACRETASDRSLTPNKYALDCDFFWPITFFELMTAMALLHFREEIVDIAILETGMGGRLDATNAIERPLISIITSIGFDHEEYLGETLEAIAGEKGGIFKEKCPVVLGWMPHEAETVLREKAANLNAPCYLVRDIYGEAIQDYPTTGLNGDYQKINAGAAVLASDILKDILPLREVSAQEAVQNVFWPGRWQTLILDERRIILDSTHNKPGAEELKRELERLNQKAIFVVAATTERRANAILSVVDSFAEAIFWVPLEQEGSVDFAILKKSIPPDLLKKIQFSDLDCLFSRNNQCFLGKRGDTIIVTGSIYLVGAVLGLIIGEQEERCFQDKMM